MKSESSVITREQLNRIADMLRCDAEDLMSDILLVGSGSAIGGRIIAARVLHPPDLGKDVLHITTGLDVGYPNDGEPMDISNIMLHADICRNVNNLAAEIIHVQGVSGDELIEIQDKMADLNGQAQVEFLETVVRALRERGKRPANLLLVN